MRVSQTIENWAGGRGQYWYRMFEVCDAEGFDLEDFLHDIWKVTWNA
jgi:hypothetical protein